MSAAAPDHEHRLTLAEQVARIERSQEETRKSVQEQHKLLAEREKPQAEAAKLNRYPWLALLVAGIALVGGIGGTLAGVATFWRLLKGAAQ